MRPNKLREIWASGGTAVNGWLTMPHPFAGEVMAHQGWDSLTIDIQHGMVDFQAAVGMLIAISSTSTVPLVRVPWLEPGILGKVLDAGAYGVICPMVNSADDAERLVAATHYPPRGRRSFGPVRGLLYGGPDYQVNANDTIVVFAMIETAEGLNNLDEILQVPDLDAVYVGPADLSIALGCQPTFDQLEKPVAEAVDYIVAKAKEHGKIAGIHTGSPEGALLRKAQGYQFVTIASDVRLFNMAAQQALAKMQDSVENTPTPQPSGGYS
jgi:4-hydroxy-2-oxoheptanedioate aldolase